MAGRRFLIASWGTRNQHLYPDVQTELTWCGGPGPAPAHGWIDMRKEITRDPGRRGRGNELRGWDSECLSEVPDAQQQIEIKDARTVKTLVTFENA
jgi:hypothetical protein